MSSTCAPATQVTPFLEKVDTRSAAAIASGDLQPIEAHEVTLDGDGMLFRVRRVKALEKKQELPGGPRDPDFNPFLPPDPALTVGPVGEEHVAILNKYPVSERHLVLARKAFAEQVEPLELSDFRAMAQVLSECGGLGFHNGGAAAGASQRHKHVQWIPATSDNPGLAMYRPVLDPDVREHTVFIHLQLPLRHCFVRVMAGRGQDPDLAARSLLRGYQRALETMGLEPDANGHLPPSNLLVEDGWMLLVPRSREHYEGVSLNALSFGGVFYVRDEAQLDAMRRVGPLQALAAVGYPV